MNIKCKLLSTRQRINYKQYCFVIVEEGLCNFVSDEALFLWHVIISLDHSHHYFVRFPFQPI